MARHGLSHDTACLPAGPVAGPSLRVSRNVPMRPARIPTEPFALDAVTLKLGPVPHS